MTRRTAGTKNVLYELGFEDAAELTAKVQLAIKFNDLIDQRSLNQTDVAALTGMTQSKVSQVRRYKLLNVSLERLMQALVALDQHVEIRVRHARRSDVVGISVSA
jgi:predicted XRE-type DNA-binding protein